MPKTQEKPLTIEELRKVLLAFTDTNYSTNFVMFNRSIMKAIDGCVEEFDEITRTLLHKVKHTEMEEIGNLPDGVITLDSIASMILYSISAGISIGYKIAKNRENNNGN